MVPSTPKQDDYTQDIPVASEDEGSANGSQETIATGRKAEDLQGRQQVSTSTYPRSASMNEYVERGELASFELPDPFLVDGHPE